MKRSVALLALLTFAAGACDRTTEPLGLRPTRPLRSTTAGTATTYTDQASFEQAVGSPMTLIDFSTRDDGSPITNPSTDASFPELTLRGATFHDVQSYWNLSIYTFPTKTIHVDLPSGTIAVGTQLTSFNGKSGTFTITLSTGQVVQQSFAGGYFPPPAFFGARSDQPIAWVDFTFDNTDDDLLIDNFEFLSVPGNTLSGSGVAVTPVDATTGQPSPVSLTFDQVTGSGTTTVSSGQVGTGGTAGAPPAPSSANFRLGSPPLYYDITTSAQFTGSVRVCVTYPDGAFTSTNNLELLHYDGTAWQVLPDQSVDASSRTVCATTTSFSPFMVAEAEVAPVVTQVALSADPVPVNTATTLQAHFTDENLGDTHTGTFSWTDGSVTGTVVESNGDGSLSATQTFATPGVYTVVASVSDGDRTGSRSSALDVPAYLVVYDASGSFVTGGGWIDSPAGACRYGACSASTSGKATFGFVSRYEPGATQPTGNTEFQFNAGGLSFRSTSYDWLVVSGARAQFKGTGQINGSGSYTFLLTAIDGQVSGGGDVDRFRIKIMDASGGVVYDNQVGTGVDVSDTADPVTAIGGGSIQIHK